MKSLYICSVPTKNSILIYAVVAFFVATYWALNATSIRGLSNPYRVAALQSQELFLVEHGRGRSLSLYTYLIFHSVMTKNNENASNTQGVYTSTSNSTKTAYNQVRIPIGFTSPIYQKGMQIHNTTEKEEPQWSQLDNLYLVSITKALKEYIQEELKGKKVFPEKELMEKIQAARILFDDERDRLIRMKLTLVQ